jgi:cytochrome P450
VPGCPIHFDPLSPEQLADPYPTYAALRASAPVFFDAKHDLWIVSRYDDILAIVRDTQTFSSHNATRASTRPLPPEVQAVLATAWPMEPTITTSDGDLHRRLRLTVTRVLTPRRMAEEEAAIRRDVDALIDRFTGGGKSSTDLIESFGWSLPLLTVTRLLGVPASDMDKFHRWSASWLRVLQATDDLDQLIAYARDVVDLERYFMAVVESPASQDLNSFVGQLLSIRLPGQEPLSKVEAMRMMVNIIVAGHVTVTRSIGNAIRLLQDHPKAVEKLRTDPAVVETMVEEILRYESPAQGLFRTTTRPAEVSGVQIPANARVMLHWGSANRDERAFDHPETFDIERDCKSQHVAFGKGVHTCPGAPLARLQLKIALPRLFERLPNLRISDAPGAAVRDTVFFARGFSTLRVEWDPKVSAA